MSALVGGVTAIDAQAGILVCIISALGGFVVGFCMGVLSAGLSGLFLTLPRAQREVSCIVWSYGRVFPSASDFLGCVLCSDGFGIEMDFVVRNLAPNQGAAANRRPVG